MLAIQCFRLASADGYAILITELSVTRTTAAVAMLQSSQCVSSSSIFQQANNNYFQSHLKGYVVMQSGRNVEYKDKLFSPKKDTGVQI